MAKNTGKRTAATKPEIPQAAMVTKASGKERVKAKHMPQGADSKEGLNDATQCTI